MTPGTFYATREDKRLPGEFESVTEVLARLDPILAKEAVRDIKVFFVHPERGALLTYHGQWYYPSDYEPGGRLWQRHT
jgi:hypothetical protein